MRAGLVKGSWSIDGNVQTSGLCRGNARCLRAALLCVVAVITTEVYCTIPAAKGIEHGVENVSGNLINTISGWVGDS